jgi:hypothetical protein
MGHGDPGALPDPSVAVIQDDECSSQALRVFGERDGFEVRVVLTRAG